MIATKIELFNWGPFRGTHSIDLEPGVYAVTASAEDNELRSNWIGKTKFLQAMRFALDGKKPKGCRLEDDWITHGETEGGVEIWYDNGLHIQRKRSRGSSTKTNIQWLDNGTMKKARQERAQEIINELSGVDDYNFSFFAQKEMAQLIEAKPSALYEQASEWFKLGKIGDGHDLLRKKLNALIASRSQLQASIDEKTPEEPFDVAAGKKRHKHLTKACKAADKALRETERLLSEAAEVGTAHKHAEEYVRLRDKGTELLKELKKVPSGITDRVSELKEEVGAAKKTASIAGEKAAERASLATGAFNGKCPVMCEACPEKSTVQKVLKKNTGLATEAEEKFKEATNDLNDKRKELSTAIRALDSAVDMRRNFDRMKARASALKEDFLIAQDSDEPEDPVELRIRARTLREEYREATDEIVSTEHALKYAAENESLVEEMTEKLSDIEEQIALYQSAVFVWSRQGAQRLVAEWALGKLQDVTNNVLAEANIDLAVEVSWTREASKGLSSNCYSCGAPFPRSQTVKHCGTCSSKRGPKLIEELSIEPSNTSGAADDLAGIAFKLASASWRRRAHSIQLSISSLDEPLAYVDEANKKAFAGHIVSMLSSRYGFEQSFVTAHDQAVLETLPKRIEIVGGENGSRFA